MVQILNSRSVVNGQLRAPGVNLGQLQRDGFVLYPREVIAIVQAVCDQDAGGATPDGMWLTPGGQVLIRESSGVMGTAAVFTDMARLIEGLLPPFSEDPDYALPISLRLLPARIRGAIEPSIASLRQLLDTIREYEKQPPSQVIQHLVSRAAAFAAGAVRADTSDPLWPERAETGSAAAIVVAVDTSEDSLDQFAVEPTAEALTVAAADADTSRHADDPVSLSDIPLAPEPVEAATAPSRPSAPLLAVAAAISLVASGYTGYWFMSHTGRSGAPALTVAAVQLPPDPPAPRTETAAPAAAAAGLMRPAPQQPAPSERSSTGVETIPSPPAVARPQQSVAAHPDVPPPEVAADPAVLQQEPVPADRAGKMVEAPLERARALVLPVTDGAFSPSFASTGAALFFHAGRRREGRLLEADLDERGAPLQIVSVLEEDAKNYHPRVSPDERRIAFDSDRDGERGVYVADRDGKNISRVSGAGFAALPSWSPDMKWLAIVRAEPDRPGVWNLWLRNLASGELKRLTSYRIGQTWSASWFPDAQRLCYSHEDQLVILNIATGSTSVFRSPLAGRLVRTPAVSPEGRRIIFQVFRDGAWILDLPTGSMRKVLDDQTAEEFAWNPRGTRLAYHSRRDGEWRIWVTAPPS